jgi:DNA adenine methylase
MDKYKKSFLKWAGGKYKILHHILQHIPVDSMYIEPFSGSGVVWLNVQNKNKIVNDINSDLINLFNLLDNNMIDACKKLFNDSDENKFYEYREEFNTTKDLYRKSILFIYLNRHCFNGLCRYNKSGKFNVPFGKYKTIYFPQNELQNFIIQKKTVSFLNTNFDELFYKFGNDKNVCIYCDPPYDVLDSTSYFVDYSKESFGRNEQKILADCILQSKCKVIISNHDTPFIREIYKGLKFIEIEVQRNISCKNRRKVNEVIIIKE